MTAALPLATMASRDGTGHTMPDLADVFTAVFLALLGIASLSVIAVWVYDLGRAAARLVRWWRRRR